MGHVGSPLRPEAGRAGEEGRPLPDVLEETAGRQLENLPKSVAGGGAGQGLDFHRQQPAARLRNPRGQSQFREVSGRPRGPSSCYTLLPMVKTILIFTLVG